MAIDIGRREFAVGISAAAAILPHAARAQQSVMPTIGFLNSRSAPTLLATADEVIE